MHVLITSDTLNGTWTYTRELISGLIGRGFRVTLVSFGEIPLPEQTAWMERLRGLDYRPTAFRLDWMHEGQQDFADASDYLCAVAADIKPDFFHSNHLCYGALPISLPRIVVAHGDLITWWKSVHGRDPRESPWIDWYRHATTQGLERASAVVAGSDWMLEAVRASYSAPMHGVVINHGRNPILFNPYVTKNNAVLAIGRILDPASQINLLAERSHPVPVGGVDAKQPQHAAETAVRTNVGFNDGQKGVVLPGPGPGTQVRVLSS